MMNYCCANGKKGLRTELEGTDRFMELSPSATSTAIQVNGTSTAIQVNGTDGVTHSADRNSSPTSASEAPVDACVDSFMTTTNKYVEDMFVQYGVDVHVTAHQHVYERTTPVYRYKGLSLAYFPVCHTWHTWHVTVQCLGSVVAHDSRYCLLYCLLFYTSLHSIRERF
jgi:hypothetical protein